MQQGQQLSCSIRSHPLPSKRLNELALNELALRTAIGEARNRVSGYNLDGNDIFSLRNPVSEIPNCFV